MAGSCAGPGSAGSDACGCSTILPAPSDEHGAAAGSPKSRAGAPGGAPGGGLPCGSEAAWAAQPGQTGGTLPRVHSANTLRQAPKGSTPWLFSNVCCVQWCASVSARRSTGRGLEPRADRNPTFESRPALQLDHSVRMPCGCTAVCEQALRATRKRRLLARVRELEAGEQRLKALEAGLAAAAEAEAAAAAAAAQAGAAAAAAMAAAERDAVTAAASGAAGKPPGCEAGVHEERPCGSGSEAGTAPTALGADALYNPDWVRGARSCGDDELEGVGEDVREILGRGSRQ